MFIETRGKKECGGEIKKVFEFSCKLNWSVPDTLASLELMYCLYFDCLGQINTSGPAVTPDIYFVFS